MVDIILPCYTKKIPDSYYKTIECLSKNTKDFNLIIVGNEDTQPKNINRGLDISTSHYKVIMDWDVYVPEGWLPKLIKVLDDHPDCGLVSPVMGGRYKETGGINNYDGGDITEYPSSVAGCMVIRDLGLRWSEDFLSGYWCDTDFCRQIKEKGYKIYLHGGLEVEHDVSTTTSGNTKYLNEMMADGEIVYFSHWKDLEL